MLNNYKPINSIDKIQSLMLKENKFHTLNYP